jgi:molybdopterin-guanine dinucleotide biosynthesis protein A
MNRSRPAIGVILTGGTSRRMGVDKAFVEVDGRAMVLRVADALRLAGCDPVVCQGGSHLLTGSLGLEVIPDPQPDSGPVLAIQAALEYHRSAILVAACDLVDLDPATVLGVITAAQADPERRVVTATADGHPHLLSHWSQEALEPLSQLVAEGVIAYRVALERLAAVEVAVDPQSVRNVNRPEDLARRR